jgi:hypothetical protein
MALVDTRAEHFYQQWLDETGGRIQFYCHVPRAPFETVPLWPDTVPGVVIQDNTGQVDSMSQLLFSR